LFILYVLGNFKRTWNIWRFTTIFNNCYSSKSVM